MTTSGNTQSGKKKAERSIYTDIERANDWIFAVKRRKVGNREEKFCPIGCSNQVVFNANRHLETSSRSERYRERKKIVVRFVIG